ncbi:Src-like-adapter 2 [Takifugu flavidus]|uniref:Src-like-adapter 2 n=1 Tax=Takifugu flavidus TaxID=433684 RepID=A0A5C6N775_9TELE|nr:Src-like-adapter 2 [Takifugu flavidus]
MGICPIRCRSNMSILENTSESSAPAQEDAIVVSLCNYPAFGQIDPTMCIGERLTVMSEWVTPRSVFHNHHDDLHELMTAFFPLNSDGDFLIVRSATTGLESYIPTSYTAKVTHMWLFTGISRYKAIELLMLPNNHNGAFLIRESQTNADGYSLSILRRSGSSYHDSVKHYRISCLPNGWFYISPRLTFPSLHHLVEHYSECADGLCCRLTAPCFIKSSEGETKLVRRPTFNWKDISRSMVFKKKLTESDNPLVSEGLREAISSYLQMTEGSSDSWET